MRSTCLLILLGFLGACDDPPPIASKREQCVAYARSIGELLFGAYAEKSALAKYMRPELLATTDPLVPYCETSLPEEFVACASTKATPGDIDGCKKTTAIDEVANERHFDRVTDAMKDVMLLAATPAECGVAAKHLAGRAGKWTDFATVAPEPIASACVAARWEARYVRCAAVEDCAPPDRVASSLTHLDVKP